MLLTTYLKSLHNCLNFTPQIIQQNFQALLHMHGTEIVTIQCYYKHTKMCAAIHNISQKGFHHLEYFFSRKTSAEEYY